MTEAERLSKLLWDAREIADMYADVIKARTGRSDDYVTRVRDGHGCRHDRPQDRRTEGRGSR